MKSPFPNSFVPSCLRVSLLVLASLSLTPLVGDPKPPVPIPLTLPKDSYLTLVIEDRNGSRVRNLVSETFFKAGEHTVYWDGMDDHGRANIGPHGNYDATGSLVAPGTYRIRGLIRDKVDLVYEFSPYNPINPPWRTADARGQWLADHTPPSCVLYVPGAEPRILIGSSLAEGAHGLVWTDLSGRKIRGVRGIGRGWAGATRLCLDKSNQPTQFIAYGLGASRFGDVTLVGIGEQQNKVLYSPKEDIPHHKSHYIVDYPVGGLAVHNGLAAISFPIKNQIVFVKIDPNASKPIEERLATLDFESPKGITFDAAGRLLILSESKLVRCSVSPDAKHGVSLKDQQTLIAEGLDDPKEIVVSRDGNIFISDHGQSHQVKVFSPAGEKLCVIGKPGKPANGPYDEEKMHHPMGMALTPQGELWVAEEDYQPKRVSLWTKDRQFKTAFYGPTEYGGGGKLDPTDKTRFYYFGMEFELDWKKGNDKVKSIFYRRDDPNTLILPNHQRGPGGNPETPVYLDGRQYMTNTYSSRPTMGPLIAGVWLMVEGIAKPVAALGQVNYWDIFKRPEFKDRIPQDIDLHAPTNQQWVYDRKPPYENALLFAWSDTNDDQKIQVNEVTFAPGKVGGLNQNDGLTFITADGLRIAPEKFTASGVPVYDLKKAKDVCPLGLPLPYTAIVPGQHGDFAVQGFAAFAAPGKSYGSASGITKNGKRWYYPNQWTGLHASQSYPVNRTPKSGELIGTTKIIGPSFKVAGGKEELWALNANSGQIYLFTIDGFFVASLFKHGYFSKPNPPTASRGMKLNDNTSDGEGFYQTITATSDGNVYVQAMNHTSSIVRVDGLNSIRRLKDTDIEVTKETLDQCLDWFTQAEIARQSNAGKKRATITIATQTPTVDGNLADWADAEWLRIDDTTEGAFRIADGKFCAAWKTLHRDLLKNSGTDPWQGMFKTGGALDIMISTSANTRTSAQRGDQRLLISKVNGKLRAIHYEQRSERKGHVAEIASPNRTVKFDHIADVSEQVSLAEGRVGMAFANSNVVFRLGIQTRIGYAYEAAVPLELFGLNSAPQKLAGDIGVLLGNGTTTIKRLYWCNKNTTMLFDAPEESLLKPGLWGELNLVAQKSFEETIRARGDKVDVLSHVMGLLDIDSTKLKSGEPCAAITWSGKGQLSTRSVGRHGYIIFRHQAKEWWGSHKPLINVTAPFEATIDIPGRFKDGLYAGSKPRHLLMYLDDQSCTGPKGFLGGSLWAGQKTTQSASWDFKVADEKEHQMTILLGTGAKQSLHLSPLDSPNRQRQLITFDGTQGMTVVQFSFPSSIRLTLEQPPYTDEDTKEGRYGRKARTPANITAIFLD